MKRRKNGSPFELGIKRGNQFLSMGKIKDGLEKEGYQVRPDQTSMMYAFKKKGNYFEAIHVATDGDYYSIYMARMSSKQVDNLPSSFGDFELDELADIRYPDIHTMGKRFLSVAGFLMALEIGSDELAMMYKNKPKRKNGTKKGQVRKTARRAYKKNPNKYTRKRASNGRMMYFKNGKICSKETYTKKL